jgi:SAM-dependent methyltransferase
MFTAYEFGYPWFLTYGHAIPLALAVAVGALAVWRGWPRWVPVLSGGVAIWAAAGLVALTVVFGANRPMELPTDRFLVSGSGRVLDAGAGSGRAAIGVLLARPQATATGLDIYSGYWGIEDNTPERFMANARAAGVAARAETRVGDMRRMPFADGEFDAVVSAYAIDHLGHDGRVEAMAEVARVLKPQGELLLILVRTDWLVALISPPMAHHPSQRPEPCRDLLQQSGFEIEEEGTPFATLYFLARRSPAWRQGKARQGLQR